MPKPKFMTLGKSKFVHTVYTEAFDLRGKNHPNGGVGTSCLQVRKYAVAGKIDYKAKGISPEAALALESCDLCATSEHAKKMLSPETKAAARKDERDDVLDRAKTGRAKGEPKKAGKAKSVASTKKSETGDKPPKVKAAPTKTKAGVRSVGSDTNGKAAQLAAFGEEHGWSVKTGDGSPGLLLTAVKGDQTISCWFIDGKYDISRHAYIEVGEWRGALRGAHACRRQMDGENPVHPNPGKGRSGPRKRVDPDVEPEDESPEDAARRVPFSLDDPDVVIIDAIKGKTIKWRNGLSGALEEAWLPAKAEGKKRLKIRVYTHPKSERRIVEFLTVDSISEHGEQYGVERSVFLDKIVRVS